MLKVHQSVDQAMRSTSPGVLFVMPWGGVGVMPFKLKTTTLAGITCLSCGAKTNERGQLPCGH